MLTPKLIRKLLDVMYRRHSAKHGHRKSNLSETFLYVTSGPELEAEIPDIFEINNGMKRYFVVAIAKELEAQGLIEFNSDNTKFWLTDLGFEEGRKRSLRRLLDFLNKNGGLSIIISLISLLVSICAFLKK